jgi:hypothetical protein
VEDIYLTTQQLIEGAKKFIREQKPPKVKVKIEKVVIKKKQKNGFSYLRQYRLSRDSFDMLRYTHQDNRCGICREAFRSTPFVDHNHITGEIRGLLCRDCNFAIGFLRDDPLLCTRAAEYLLSHPRL